MRKQKEFDREQNILERIEFYNKAYSFPGLRDKSHESEASLVTAQKGSSYSQNGNINKEGKEKPNTSPTLDLTENCLLIN